MLEISEESIVKFEFIILIESAILSNDEEEMEISLSINYNLRSSKWLYDIVIFDALNNNSPLFKSLNNEFEIISKSF